MKPGMIALMITGIALVVLLIFGMFSPFGLFKRTDMFGPFWNSDKGSIALLTLTESGSFSYHYRTAILMGPSGWVRDDQYKDHELKLWLFDKDFNLQKSIVLKRYTGAFADYGVRGVFAWDGDKLAVKATGSKIMLVNTASGTVKEYAIDSPNDGFDNASLSSVELEQATNLALPIFPPGFKWGWENSSEVNLKKLAEKNAFLPAKPTFGAGSKASDVARGMGTIPNYSEKVLRLPFYMQILRHRAYVWPDGEERPFPAKVLGLLG
jgi:hypothetical protein